MFIELIPGHLFAVVCEHNHVLALIRTFCFDLGHLALAQLAQDRLLRFFLAVAFSIFTLSVVFLLEEILAIVRLAALLLQRAFLFPLPSLLLEHCHSIIFGFFFAYEFDLRRVDKTIRS